MMKRKIRLREKFLLPTVLLLLLGMIGLTIVLYTVSRNELLSQSNLQLEEYGARTSTIVESWLERTILDLTTLAEQEVLQAAIPDTFVGRSARGAASEQLTLFKDRYQFYGSLQVLDSDQGVVSLSEDSEDSEVEQVSDNSFEEAMGGSVSISHIFYSEEQEDYLYVITVPVKREGEVLGVLQGFIRMERFAPAMVGDIHVGATGYAFIVDDRDRVIAHPDRSQIGTTTLRERAQTTIPRDDHGLFDYTYLQEDWVLAYHRIPLSGWVLCITQKTGEILAASNRIRAISIFLALGITIMIIIVMLVVSSKITKPAKDLLSALSSLKEGDLKTPIAIKASDEFGDLALGIEAMRENLRDLALAIKQSAEKTTITSQELASGTEETNTTIQEVADSVSLFSTTTEELSHNSQSMADTAEEVSQLAFSGQEQMNKTQLQMEDIIVSAEEASKTIKGLETSSYEIENIAGVISNVADQTNLLALNAAIEAARAGEHGQGFAVVADEVRKLAVETQRSVGEIKEIIGRLSKSTGEAVKVIDGNNQKISIGAETLNQSGDAFKEIVNRIESIHRAVQNVASASQELSASSQEISAATEEQSASMEEIASSAEALATMAHELTSLVDQLSL